MKKLVFPVIFCLVIFSINNTYGIMTSTVQKTVDPDSSETDTVEYKLIVFDTGYESYLSNQPPMEFYSEQYYRNRNIQYVNEWNNRHLTRAGSGLYETYIDYDPLTKYGIELEYKLYYYFRYFEEKNNVHLLVGGK